MSYIIASLKSIGFNVNVLALGESNKLQFSKSVKVDCQENYCFTSTFYTSNLLFKLISRIWLFIQVIYFVFFKTEKNPKIIFYHSYYFIKIMKFTRLFKKFELIYEIEEIFKAAWNKNKSEVNHEISQLNFADKYIFVNDLMNDYFGYDKDYVVCYGNYSRINFFKSNLIDNKIKIVYAGIIGGENSDVFFAINVMKFLPSNYELGIVGYGTEDNLNNLKKYIDKNKDARIKYDGLLTGEDLTNYLGKFHIGISSRLLKDELSNFTFPSKVLFYLSHNLITVSTDIKCIRFSKVSNLVHFVNELDYEKFAIKISNIDKKHFYDNQSNYILEELDVDFKNSLRKLLIG
ncbi:glycosyltransferase family protein [Aquirufa sp. OSTEICH-129A]